MSELAVFKNEDFGDMRTTTINGEPWFVAADVCAVFGGLMMTKREYITWTPLAAVKQ